MYCTKISLLFVFACTSILDVYGSENLPKTQSSVKIVGGSDTTIQNHPYQVYLLLTQAATGFKYQCSGTIANNRCVITAAHCLTGKMSVEVRAGSTNSCSGGTTYNSRMLVSHPRYNSTTKDFDVGVIRLNKRIKLDGTNTSTINFPSSNCTVSPALSWTVSGWGYNKENGDFSPNLKELSVKAVAFDDCKKEYTRLTDRMVCAGTPESGKGACLGDSGGPLVRTGTNNQVGIVAFAKGCGSPGVYTNLCNQDIQNWLKEMNCA